MSKDRLRLYFLTILLTINILAPPTKCYFERISAKSLLIKQRDGPAPKTFHCDLIREISTDMRNDFKLPNDDIVKYTEVYGIPIVATDVVIDEALYRACYVTAFVFAHRADIRDTFYQGKGFVRVLGFTERPNRPPAACKITGWWRGYDNQRGVPPTKQHPYVIGAEENILCPHKWKLIDPYRQEDMLLHQMAHAVLSIMFLKYPRFQKRLRRAFRKAKSHKKWHSLYAGKNIHEYFAEGTQSFFNVNVEGAKKDRVHGSVNTRHELKRYDLDLYNFVAEVFPCTDDFIRKCEVNPKQSALAVWQLEMDCKKAKKTFLKCKDHNIWCTKWAEQGECEKNPLYMRTKCRATCRNCRKSRSVRCFDFHDECEVWAILGECKKNPGFMLVHCRLSCNDCADDDLDANEDPAIRVCRDEAPQCPGWKILGECRKTPAYMREFCRKTCKFC